MIKKELKTLGQLQKPSKSDTRRYRIHLEDGGHIDVTGIEERNSMIRNLVNAGRLHYGDINTNEIGIPRATETQEVVVKKSFKELVKEDFGDWSWKVFALMSLLSIGLGTTVSIIRFIFDGPIVLSTVPILKTLPLTTDILYTIGLVSAITICSWIFQRGWRLLAYITCWFKLGLALFLFLFTFLSIGFFSGSMAEKICDFIGGHTFTKKEHKIMSSIL